MIKIYDLDCIEQLVNLRVGDKVIFIDDNFYEKHVIPTHIGNFIFYETYQTYGNPINRQPSLNIKEGGLVLDYGIIKYNKYPVFVFDHIESEDLLKKYTDEYLENIKKLVL